VNGQYIQLDKLVLAKHSISEGHHINSDTLVLAKLAGYIDYVVKEAIDICLHPGS
jgi:hypothetical protein